jgi:hypothetical protein
VAGWFDVDREVDGFRLAGWFWLLIKSWLVGSVLTGWPAGSVSLADRFGLADW